MRELRFDGLSEDGSRLVLVGKDGQRWSVLIDERIEAAVRRDRARLGQVEIERSGELRPREIQARIRAGATAEDVAAASGLPLERIRRFEGPVLTERAWTAQQAGLVMLRRPSGDVAVAELVTTRLLDQGVAESDITWDSWRTEEGTWTVIATFPLGAQVHVATWTYDPGARTMTAQDENAEDLTAATAPSKLRLVASRPSLSAVAALPEEQADTPVAPEPDPVVPNRPAEPEASAQPTAEEPQEAPARLPSAPRPAAATPRSVHQAKRQSRHPSGSQLPSRDSEPAPAPRGETAPAPVPPAADPGVDEGLFESDVEPSAKPRPGRSAVPSFDDILFGPAPKKPPTRS